MGITNYILGSPVTGIFWDYENVPLRHADWEPFLQGLINYVSSNRVEFARVYARKKTLSKKDRNLIKNTGLFDFKWIRSDEQNAADYSLINSCMGVLKNNEHINQVILISGDGDFNGYFRPTRSCD